MISALLQMLVTNYLIRVESFSIIKHSGPYCFPTALCRPLQASFTNDEENPNASDRNRSAKNDIEILKEFREKQLREAVLEDQFLSNDVSRRSDSDSSSNFISLFLVGQAKLPLAERATESGEESKKNGKQSFATVLVTTPRKYDASFENGSNKKDKKVNSFVGTLER